MIHIATDSGFCGVAVVVSLYSVCCGASGGSLGGFFRGCVFICYGLFSPLVHKKITPSDCSGGPGGLGLSGADCFKVAVVFCFLIFREGLP